MKQGRKISGGKYHKQRKKKKHEKQTQRNFVKIGETKAKKISIRGGNEKIVLLKANTCNVIINGKAKKATIKNVLETPSNRFLARQNILEKNSLIETDLGKARITNRPSQEAIVQAVLVEDKE